MSRNHAFEVALPNFTVTVEQKGPERLDFYIVRNDSGEEVYRSRIYSFALRHANLLQEQISVKTPPQGYAKVFLITIGGLSLFRTVKTVKGKLVWTYVAEDPRENRAITAPTFLELCMNAVDYECGKREKQEVIS